MKALKIFAGSHALAHIQQAGLKQEDIQLILAASGGPKWFAIESIDRYLLGEWFAKRTAPLHLLGTSAGAFRMACYAQSNPLAALSRFLEGYLSQQYSARPSGTEISVALQNMVRDILQHDGAREIITNPVMKFNTLVARSKGWAASDNKSLQAIGLGGTMLANAVHPAAMRLFVERVLFHHQMSLPIQNYPSLPARHVAITENNLPQVLVATGSIPVVIDGVRNIPDAPQGMYRDGGVTDYQFDLPCRPSNGLVLYPHYSAQPPKGGWFDKALAWRQARKENYSHTIILAPSAQFAASLPGGKIPERQDFYDLADYPTRRAHWQRSLQQLAQLGDELAEIDQRNRWAEVVEPLPW